MQTSTMTTTTTANTYVIFEEYWPGTQKKLDRIARKCAALGCPFVYEVRGDEYRTESLPNDATITRRFIVVEVSGTAKIDDWEFVATVEICPSGNIIRRYNNFIDVPERFRTSSNVCEHCHTSRPRNNLYIIRNTKTGEFKQVGGSCLKLYTHGLSLELIVAWVDGLTELERLNNFVDPEDLDPMGGYVSVGEVVRYAAAVIKKTGYFKACDQHPTRNVVSQFIFARNLKMALACIEDGHMLPAGIKLDARDALNCTDEEVNAILNYYMSLDPKTEFVHNVQTMIQARFVKPANLGYLCYLPQGYYAHLAKEREQQARATEKHEHYGEEGKRYKGAAVKNVRKVTSYLTEYGITYIYNIIIEDDIVLTWKSTKALDTDAEAYSKIDFTVKGHDEYKGTSQTLVTRCKLY